jgi:hypothetical protein
MDEGWDRYFRSDFNNLYHCEYDKCGRSDLRSGCNQFGELGDVSVSNVNSERRAGGTFDHDAAFGAVRDGRAVGIVYGGGDGVGHVDVSMDKGRHRYFGSDNGYLYNSKHDKRRRWELRGGCDQFGEFGDINCGNLDGERRASGTDNHDAAFGAVGDSRPIGILYSRGDGVGDVDVSMDEGWNGNFGRKFGNFYDREHFECERWDLRGGRHQHGGFSDVNVGNVDGERRAGGTDDHDAAFSAVGHSGAVGIVYGGSDRFGRTDLSMDKGRHRHFGSDLGHLYNSEYDERKRGDLRGGCNQLGELSHIYRGNLDGKCRARGTDDHDAAFSAVGHSGAVGIVYGGSDRLGHTDLSMDKGWHRYFGSDLAHLYNNKYDKCGCWNVLGCCDQLG